MCLIWLHTQRRQNQSNKHDWTNYVVDSRVSRPLRVAYVQSIFRPSRSGNLLPVWRFALSWNASVTPRQPTRLTTTNAAEINEREYGVNTCLGTTCQLAKLDQFDPWQVVLRQVFTPYNCLLVSVGCVVLCRVGCLWVTGACKWWYHGRGQRLSLNVGIGVRFVSIRRNCTCTRKT